MKRFKAWLFALALLALLPQSAALADNDNPTVAILSFGHSATYQLTHQAIFESLEAYGYLSADERDQLAAGADVHAERISILFRDAGFDFPTANLMVEDALDEGADVLLTLSNEVGMVAAGLLESMEDPPPLFFAIVTAPSVLGLGSSSCVKPDYITGTAMYIDFENYVPASSLQEPGLSHMGLLYDPSDPTSTYFLDYSRNAAKTLGFTLDVAAYLSPTDIGLATQSLIDKGSRAIAIMPHTSADRGIASVIQTAYGIPVYSLLASDVYYGVTIGTGFDGWYREGATVASMMVGYLHGELNTATTGIHTTDSYRRAVNLDSAELQGIQLSQALLDMVDYVIQDGEAIGSVMEIPGVGSTLPTLTPEERLIADQELFASLHCSDEMIAEQLAALDAPATESG